MLSFADTWQLTMLAELEEYLSALTIDHTEYTKTNFLETLNKVNQHNKQFSTARIEKVLQQFILLSAKATTRKNDEVDLQVSCLNVPQSLLDSLKSQAEPHLKEVTLFGDGGAGSKDKSIRNNHHFMTSLPNGFLPLALLERLMSLSMGTSIEFAEPAVILSYQQNQYYHWHYDALYPHNNSIQQQIEQFGQRVKTAIFYINDDFTGGNTEFKKPFISIEPKQGNVISFNNCDSQGKRLTESLHRGSEVTTGEKWIVTLWFRSKPFWLRSNFFS